VGTHVDETRNDEPKAVEADAGDIARDGNGGGPELFSPPRLPAVSSWRYLTIGALGVSTIFAVQFSIPERARWLLPVTLWGLVAGAAMLALAYRVWRRARLRSGGYGVVLQLIHARWEETGILAPEAATWEDVARFEHEYGVRLPADVRRYFLTLNGTTIGEHGGVTISAVGVSRSLAGVQI
jgi:hypothetical protein